MSGTIESLFDKASDPRQMLLLLRGEIESTLVTPRGAGIAKAEPAASRS